jgi:hypothetical protein
MKSERNPIRSSGADTNAGVSRGEKPKKPHNIRAISDTKESARPG